jgi:hypothetical protein
MPLPRPEPGLVIPYEYLWQDEAARRKEWGKKIRPCAIIVAVTGESGEIETVVAPITHLEPTPPSEGIEIPLRVKKQLGLDEQRSWVHRNRSECLPLAGHRHLARAQCPARYPRVRPPAV